MKLREVGEDRLLEQLLGKLRSGRDVVVGAGDDCALVKSGKRGLLQVLKTDCLVEGIHFANKTRPDLVGWKAMARPLSDFAAMSAVPRFALVTLIVPSDRTVAWVKGLYRGLEKAARSFDVSVVGGETSDTKGPAIISITVAGLVEKNRWVGRAGGKPGDDLFVTGRLGGSLGERHLKFVPRIAESRWLTKYFRVHAMMDLSDGLGADLSRLASASKVGFKIDRESLPRNPGCTIDDAISNGEDYELLFALASRDRKRLEDSWKKKFPKLLLSRIGRLNSAFGTRHSAFPKGYVHFKKR
jgi:thiamine-monophosphate kinase